MRALAGVVLLLATGCAGAIPRAASDATQAAVATLDDPAQRRRLDDLAASAAGAARDAALGPETDTRLAELAGHLSNRGLALVAGAREQALGPQTRADVVALRRVALDGLELELRQLARAAMDEALGEATRKLVDALREQLVGAPLQADVDALAPHVAVAVERSAGAVRIEADAELARYRWIAIGLGVLVVALIALHVRREIVLRRIDAA